jgi:hypothetical protein
VDWLIDHGVYCVEDVESLREDDLAKLGVRLRKLLDHVKGCRAQADAFPSTMDAFAKKGTSMSPPRRADVAAEAGASAKRGPTEASSAAAEPCSGGSAAAREGIVVAMARQKVMVEPSAGGVGGACQVKAVAEWSEPNWEDLQLGESDPAPWPFKILFVGVNNDVKPDLCLRDELKAIQAALDKGVGLGFKV